MGFWHTGYMDMYGPTDLEGALQTLPPRIYVCDKCGEEFGSDEELREHRFSDHPLKAPRLYVLEREVGASVLRLSDRLEPADVQAVGASCASVNGTWIAARSLGRELAHVTSGVCDIVLSSEAKVERRFRLDFRVPAKKDIVGVEASFADLEKGLKLDRAAIDSFIMTSAQFSSADGYREGISEYLFGVMAQEQGGTIAGEPAERRYRRATTHLDGYRTPLSRTICAVAEFHCCNFALACGHQAASATCAASLAFIEWLGASGSGPEVGRRRRKSAVELGRLEAALMHETTRRVVEWAVRECPLSRAEAEEVEGLRATQRDAYDDIKLGVLLGEAYRARKRWSDALRIARSLEGRSDTEHWARQLRRQASCRLGLATVGGGSHG